MKKLVFTFGLLFVGLVSQAQHLSKHAIGLRLGNNKGLGYEISYQHAVSESNRLQFDLGFSDREGESDYKLTGIYQWVWDLSDLAPGFNWFAGAGGGVGSRDSNVGSKTFLNVDGNVGIEYNFDFPLQLSLDSRPEIALVNGYNNLSVGVALGVRYKF